VTVAADGDAGPLTHPRHREQAAAVGQLHVEAWPGRVELPLRQAATAADLPEELDEFLRGRRHRRARDLAAVGVDEEHLVVPIADDVGDPLVVEQWLEPAELEEPVEDCVGDGLLVILAEQWLPAARQSAA
jgi:hypothetical protein